MRSISEKLSKKYKYEVIAKLLLKYNKNNQIIDYYFIYKIIKELIYHLDLENFFNSISFVLDEEFALTYNKGLLIDYDFYSKKISMNMEYYKDFIKLRQQKNQSVQLINSSILEELIKELLVIKNNKIIVSDEILNNCVNITYIGMNNLKSFEDKKNFYDINKKIIPVERYSSIESIRIVKDILKINPTINKEIILRKDIKELIKLLYGYEEGKKIAFSPTVRCFYKLNVRDEVEKYWYFNKNVIHIKQIEKDIRLNNGLHLLMSEYNELKAEYVKKKSLLK